MINNIQVGLIFLIIIFLLIIIFSSLGTELIFYVQNDSLKKFNTHYLIDNVIMLYNIKDKNLPYLIYLNPVMDKNRFDKISEKYNVIQLCNKNNYIKYNLRKKILRAFDIITSNIENKNIHIYGLCSYTDIACYITHKRPNVVKSLILDIPIHDFIYTLKNVPLFYWTKFFYKDVMKINKKFDIKCNILILHYDKEQLCELKYSLMKAKLLHTNHKNIFLYIMKEPTKKDNMFLNHAQTYTYKDYLSILQKWIH